MGLKLAAIVIGALVSSVAMAQDYGLTLGVHQTTATVTTTGQNAFPAGSAEGKLNYDLGLTASFELIPNFRFRSGILYDTRNYDFKIDGNGGKIHVNYSYIDVPVNAQYNFTPMVGIYGGLIVGIKASSSMDTPAGVTYDGSMKSMYPLVNLGVNFMFNDMIGFDVYGESGLGEFADNQKNYQTFGLHFIYWL